MREKVTVEAPASSANLGAGFDVFAVALEKPKDRLTVERAGKGIKIVSEGLRIATSSRRNVVAAVARAVIEGEDVKEGVSILIRKGVPIGAGLGSSAASSVATVVGIDTLFNLGLSREKQIEYAGIGEKVASGARHLDNVTASLLGGFVIISKSKGFRTMAPPPDLTLCLATPEIKLPVEKTKYARALLPKEVPLDELVSAVASASLMVHGFAFKIVEEIGSAMTSGYVDSKRTAMIPGFAGVRKSALDEGAAGVCISGAGPTVLAIAKREPSGKVLAAMKNAFENQGVKCSGFITRPGRGCRVID